MPGHNPDNLSCSNLGLRGEAHDAALEMTLEGTAWRCVLDPRSWRDPTVQLSELVGADIFRDLENFS
jgi:hypothetical protein